MNTEKPSHRAYIPADTRLPEMTLRAVVTGTILGIIFGASSLYLVLKVGLTVSASIPVAVISITLFRLLSKFRIRDASILEHNIVADGRLAPANPSPSAWASPCRPS